jgi:RNA-binding protein
VNIELTSVQRKALKARAHPLHPVVMVGDKGLTAAVLHEIDVSLKSHELIKVHVANGERGEREVLLQSMCSHLGAQAVQHIGRILVIYREKPAEPPPERRRAPPQRLRARTLAKAGPTARATRPRPRPAPASERSAPRPRRTAAPAAGRPPTARSPDASTAASAPARSKRPSANSPRRKTARPARTGRVTAVNRGRPAASSGRAPAKPRGPRPARTR